MDKKLDLKPKQMHGLGVQEAKAIGVAFDNRKLEEIDPSTRSGQSVLKLKAEVLSDGLEVFQVLLFICHCLQTFSVCFSACREEDYRRYQL